MAGTAVAGAAKTGLNRSPQSARRTLRTVWGTRRRSVMTLDDVMRALAALGSASTRKTLIRHGAPEPLFGVRIGDLKPLQKKLKGQQELALKLYATKNSDAMYLAGLIADGSKMTRRQLDQWVAGATWHMLAG